MSTRRQQVFGTDVPVALVLGSGAKRVGNSIARLLANEGYQLAIHANRSLEEAEATARQLREIGTPAIAVQGNIAVEADARRIVRETYQHFARIDVLVCAAAIWRPIKLEEVTAAEVRENFEINTLGSFVCAQEAGLLMASQPSGGTIILIGDWAIVRPYKNYAGYFPSKGAIPTLTRTLAVELASRNPRVRVNAVLPGPVMLPADLPPAEREHAIAGTLVKREGTPEHVAHAVLALVENDFITGVCLPVDGGRTIASGE
ncbi:short-chain dehydrogenase/reductase SDR [Pirellula staleyi DSM 6068]|uniref:Short-chain dehydrogenase/reductase SDR n=1 Tax=Pirellula staleyi (strain ATCC 27377 / DSM 6068 / ICPB 4128) TaxID=530564 RepID=D2R8B8_PIRSD|nr:SDR family oxidoreductase [Pirellula staleyi]ADB15735.1 short-chain dehydrogenase/reductase SDR [Pirellula staleyi DSM 6068]